jgi:hypothetical protein
LSGPLLLFPDSSPGLQRISRRELLGDGAGDPKAVPDEADGQDALGGDGV